MRYLDIAFRILSALVIPLILWGVSLQVRLAVQDSEIARLQSDVKEAQALRDGLTNNSNSLARLEEKINATNDSLKDIRDLLRSAPH